MEKDQRQVSWRGKFMWNRILAVASLVVLVPAAAVSSFLWIYSAILMAWKRDLGFGKDVPILLLLIPLSFFCIRWSVSAWGVAMKRENEPRGITQEQHPPVAT